MDEPLNSRLFAVFEWLGQGVMLGTVGTGIEEQDWWAELLRQKDTCTLRELASQFNCSPGEISAALKRAGVHRIPKAAGLNPNAVLHTNSNATGALPPEPEAQGTLKVGRRRIVRPEKSDAEPLNVKTDHDAAFRARVGSKDQDLIAHMDLLGQVPDAEIAKLARVSVRTVAGFRARNGIQGYSGPRRAKKSRGQRPSRVDPFIGVLGTVPDRVVAERAGVSLNAVRNYRVRHGIAAAGKRNQGTTEHNSVSTGSPNEGIQAFRVVFSPGEESGIIVLAGALSEAAEKGTHIAEGRQIVRLEWLGPVHLDNI